MYLAGDVASLKALFFDFDGMLVNAEPLHFQMWQQLPDYGVGLTEEQYAGVPTAGYG